MAETDDEEFERRVREAEAAGIPNAREMLAIASGRSDGCTEGEPDVTLAEKVDARPTLAERVRALNRPDVRLVETDEQAATVIFFGEAAEPEEPADT
ncbi:MAG: hypothetical protein H0U90_02070 [Actinobacteria bacterium]|nr:hypothetical protein [Actinomycetota bacterium]